MGNGKTNVKGNAMQDNEKTKAIDAENFTKCPNKIIDALITARLTGTQFAIVMLIIRNTYGYREEYCTMSISYIAKAVNADIRWVGKQLQELIGGNIVIAFGEPGKTRSLKVNENIELWCYSTTVLQDYGVKTHVTMVLKHHQIKKERKYSSSNTRTREGEIFKLYEQNICPLSPVVIDELKDLLQTHSTELIKLAISEAAKANARSIKYILGIIRNWDNNGIKTVEAAQLAISQHKNTSERKSAQNRTTDIYEGYNKL